MNKDTAVVSFEIVRAQKVVDIEIPLDISADDLVKALNSAYSLGIDTSNPRNCFIQAENPIALLKGNRILRDFGIHSGTTLRFTE